MPTRTETLLASVPKSARIIEIGPSFNPVAPRSEGWNSASLDHMTREGLVAKYRDHAGVDPGRIEPVDFIWTGGSLSDAVPREQHGSFDVFLASHVIEHTPDMVAFLQAAETLLKPDGAVVLAVPDKRFCFDCFQPVTTTGQVLEAHARRRTRHDRERAFDHFAYAVADGGLEAWGQRPSQGLQLTHDLETAVENARICEDSTGYHDLHAWHFVPSSFELMLLELGRLGRTDWRVERIACPGGWEFFAWLGRGAGAHVKLMPAQDLHALRLALLKRTLLETQPQIDWLLEGNPEMMNGQAGLSEWTSLILHRRYAEVSDLQNRLSAAEARYGTAMQRLAAVEASTFRRATAPLRRLLDRVTRAVRRGRSGLV